MAKSDATSPAGGAQSIEQLTARYTSLNKKKIQTDTQVETARNRLKEVQDKARTTYGTDDILQLKVKLAEITEANTRKLAEYGESLNSIDQALREVEAKFAPAPEGDGPPW